MGSKQVCRIPPCGCRSLRHYPNKGLGNSASRCANTIEAESCEDYTSYKGAEGVRG